MNNTFKKGDKLKCLRTIMNVIDKPLFVKDETYDVLDVDEGIITLNHILYANEYAGYDINFILRNFKKE